MSITIIRKAPSAAGRGEREGVPSAGPLYTHLADSPENLAALFLGNTMLWVGYDVRDVAIP